MKNSNLILKLVDNSINAFGQLLGLTEEEKLNKTLYVIQSTILETFNLDSSILSQEKLAAFLSKNTFGMEQAQQLTNLLWSQAELLFKLNQKNQSLIHYENALEVMQWKVKQPTDKGVSERKNKIIELESIIENLEIEIQNNIH